MEEKHQVTAATTEAAEELEADWVKDPVALSLTFRWANPTGLLGWRALHSG